MVATQTTHDAKRQAGSAAGGLKTFSGLVVCLGLLLVRIPMLAHHSFSAVFDVSKPVTLSGVITKVEWSNPHVYFYADVKGTGGKIVNWTFQMASPQSLVKRGWTRDTLRVRDHIAVMGYQARGDALVASAREVVLMDGRKLITGCTYDGGPQ
jgi:hypothetical protein